MQPNPREDPNARGVPEHLRFRGGSKTVCTSAVLAAFGINSCSYHYSGQLKQRLAILRKNGWAARSRNSHLKRGYRNIGYKPGVKTVARAKYIIKWLTHELGRHASENSWGDPKGTRYMIRVQGHALLLDYDGEVIVDTSPRKKDRRKVLDIRAVFPNPQRESAELGEFDRRYRNPISDKRRQYLMDRFQNKLTKKVGSPIQVNVAKREADIRRQMAIIGEADPSKSGSYCEWIMNLVINNKIKLPEDSEKTRELLSTYHRIKRRLPVEYRQIKNFNSTQQLFMFVKKWLPETKSVMELQKEGVQSIFRDLINGTEYQIIRITNAKAASKAANMTNWCVCNEGTAAAYLREGPLYLILRDQKKYGLIHCQSMQFMDTNDCGVHPISTEEYGDLIKLLQMAMDSAIDREEVLARRAREEGATWSPLGGSLPGYGPDPCPAGQHLYLHGEDYCDTCGQKESEATIPDPSRVSMALDRFDLLLCNGPPHGHYEGDQQLMDNMVGIRNMWCYDCGESDDPEDHGCPLCKKFFKCVGGDCCGLVCEDHAHTCRECEARGVGPAVKDSEPAYYCDECATDVGSSYNADYVCNEHLTECAGCGSDYGPSDLVTLECCDVEVCEDCQYRCESCENAVCGDHLRECGVQNNCYGSVCSECTNSCPTCGTDYCDSCEASNGCDSCGSTCPACSTTCEHCDGDYCESCVTGCEDCDCPYDGWDCRHCENCEPEQCSNTEIEEYVVNNKTGKEEVECDTNTHEKCDDCKKPFCEDCTKLCDHNKKKLCKGCYARAVCPVCNKQWCCNQEEHLPCAYTRKRSKRKLRSRRR